MPSSASSRWRKQSISRRVSGKNSPHRRRAPTTTARLPSGVTSSLDPSTPAEVIHARVAETIAELGLTDVAHNRIGTAIQRGVSGGQKRRVTIGASLVALPRILFLDEPTSGLDSRTSAEVLSASA